MKSLWVIGIVLGLAVLSGACTMFSDSSEYAAVTAKDTVLGHDTAADSNPADQTGSCNSNGRCEVDDAATCVDCFKKCDQTDAANLGNTDVALARSAQCHLSPLCTGSPCLPAECISKELGVRQECGECIDSGVECGMNRCALTCLANFSSPGCLSCLDSEGCPGIVPKCISN